MIIIIGLPDVGTVDGVSVVAMLQRMHPFGGGVTLIVPSRTLMVQSFSWNGRRHYGPDSAWYEPGQIFIQLMKIPAIGRDD